MKAYITCPASHTKERLKLLPFIEKIAREKGMETFVFKIGGSPEEIFKRDYEVLKTCDILIAEVSERSHGVGVELGLSYCLGLERILLLEKGKFISKFVEGMPGTSVIEYGNETELRDKLKSFLGSLL